MSFYRTHRYSKAAVIRGLAYSSSSPGKSGIATAIGGDPSFIKNKVRVFSRWIKNFKQDGIDGLVDKRAGNNYKIDDELLESAIYAVGARGIREAYYQMHKLYAFWMNERDTGIADFDLQSDKVISYSAVVAGIKRLRDNNFQMDQFLRYGKDGLLQGHIVGVRDINYINQEWQVDSTKFDFMVKVPDLTRGHVPLSSDNLTNAGVPLSSDNLTNADVPLSSDNLTNAGVPLPYIIKRLSLIAVTDVYSGKTVAVLSDTQDSYAQVRALYRAFSVMGMPDMIKSDNGLDYVSNHYVDLLSDMGVEHKRAHVGQGREKGSVERFFGVVQSDLSLLPGYIGNDVDKRHKIEDQTASKIEIRTSQATRHNPDRLLNQQQMQELIDKHLNKKYEDYKEFNSFLIADERLLKIKRQLGKRYIRKASGEGIRLNKKTYQSHQMWVAGVNQGNRLYVFENIDNMSEVYLFDLDMNYLGTGTDTVLGDQCMNIEQYKKAKAAHSAQHIKPVKQKVGAAQIALEKYQDDLIESMSESVIARERATAAISCGVDKPLGDCFVPRNDGDGDARNDVVADNTDEMDDLVAQYG